MNNVTPAPDGQRKVLLLFPDFGGSRVFYDIMEPLVLEILSAIAIEEGCDSTLVDLRMDKRGLERLGASDYQPDLIGITGRGYHEVPATNRLLKRCKELWPQTPIVLGGGQATITPELYDQEHIDVLVKGPGERLWREMCQEGVTVQENCHIVQDENPAAIFSYPLPDRASTQKHRSKYVFYMPRHDGKSAVPASFTFTTQGCPHRCTFCSIWPANLGLYRRRPIPEIIAELETIENDYVFLMDDNMLAVPHFAEELARAIEEAGIEKEYTAYSRADHIVDNPHLVEQWAKIGLRHVVVGIEAVGGDEELEGLNKRATMAQNVRALQILRESGVYCYAHILLTPEMTRAHFDRVYDFVADNAIEYPVLPYLTPLPGTELFEKCKNEGSLLTENPEYYTFVYMVIRPQKLTPSQYYREANRLYRRIWSWRRYLSGRCGDTTLRGFLQWWLFARLMVVYLYVPRWRLLRDAG